MSKYTSACEVIYVAHSNHEFLEAKGILHDIELLPNFQKSSVDPTLPVAEVAQRPVLSKYKTHERPIFTVFRERRFSDPWSVFDQGAVGMRYVAILVFAIFFLASSASFCAPRTITVGATLPLSGRIAHVGQEIVRGLELAKEDFSSPELLIQVVVDDNQHLGIIAATSAQKLLNQDKVDALISLWDMADIVAPLAEAKQIPHFAIRFDPEISNSFKYTITIESTYRSFVDSQLRLLSMLSKPKIALLTEEARGWILATDYLKQTASRYGLEVVGEQRFALGDTELASAVRKMLALKPDAIVITSNPPLTELLIEQVKSNAPDQFFTGYFEVLENPKLVEGVPFAAQFDVARWFQNKFQARYGEKCLSRGPHAYDAVHTLSLILASNEKPISSEKLDQRLHELSTIAGATGTLTINESRNIASPCVWKIAHGATFERFDEKLWPQK